MRKVRLRARQGKAGILKRGAATTKGRTGDTYVPADSPVPPPPPSPPSDSPPNYRRSGHSAEDVHLGSALGPGQNEAGRLAPLVLGKIYSNATLADRLDMYPDSDTDAISSEVRKRRAQDAILILATANIQAATISPMWLGTRISLFLRAIARALQGGAITQAQSDACRRFLISEWAPSEGLLRADPDEEDENEITIHAMEVTNFGRRMTNAQLRDRLAFYPDYHSGIVGSRVALLRRTDALYCMHNKPLPPPPSMRWLDERRALYDIVLRRVHERGCSEEEKIYNEAAMDAWYEHMKDSLLRGEVNLDRIDDEESQRSSAIIPTALLGPIAIEELANHRACAGNPIHELPLLSESERKAQAVRTLLSLPKRIRSSARAADPSRPSCPSETLSEIPGQSNMKLSAAPIITEDLAPYSSSLSDTETEEHNPEPKETKLAGKGLYRRRVLVVSLNGTKRRVTKFPGEKSMDALDRYQERLEDLGDSWLEDAKDTVHVQSTSEMMTLHLEQREDRVFIASESETDPDGEKHAKERAKKNAKKKKLKQKKKQAVGEGQAGVGGEVQQTLGIDVAEAIEAPAVQPIGQTTSASVTRLPDQPQPITASASVAQPSASAHEKTATEALLALATGVNVASPVADIFEQSSPSMRAEEETPASSLVTAGAAPPTGSITGASKAKEARDEMLPPPVPVNRTAVPTSDDGETGVKSAELPVAGDAPPGQDPLVGLGIALGVDPERAYSAMKPSTDDWEEESSDLPRKRSSVIKSPLYDPQRYKAIVDWRLAYRAQLKQHELEEKAKAAKASRVQDKSQSAGSEQEKPVIVAEEKAQQARSTKDATGQSEAVPAVSAVPAVPVASALSIGTDSKKQPTNTEDEKRQLQAVTSVPVVGKGKTSKKKKKASSKAAAKVAPQKEPDATTTDRTTGSPANQTESASAGTAHAIAPSVEVSIEPALSSLSPIAARQTENLDTMKGDLREELDGGVVPPLAEAQVESSQRRKEDQPQVPDQGKTSPQGCAAETQPSTEPQRVDASPDPDQVSESQSEKRSADKDVLQGEKREPSGGQGDTARTTQDEAATAQPVAQQSKKDVQHAPTEPDRSMTSAQTHSAAKTENSRPLTSTVSRQKEDNLPPWELVGAKKMKVKREPSRQLEEAASKIPGSKAWVAGHRGEPAGAKVADIPHIIITAPVSSESAVKARDIAQDKVTSKAHVANPALLALPARSARESLPKGSAASIHFNTKETGRTATVPGTPASVHHVEQRNKRQRPPVNQPVRILSRKEAVAPEISGVPSDIKAQSAVRNEESKTSTQKNGHPEEEPVTTSSATERAFLLYEVDMAPLTPRTPPMPATASVEGTLGEEDMKSISGIVHPPSVVAVAAQTMNVVQRPSSTDAPHGSDARLTQPEALEPPQDDSQRLDDPVVSTETLEGPDSDANALPRRPDNTLTNTHDEWTISQSESTWDTAAGPSNRSDGVQPVKPDAGSSVPSRMGSTAHGLAVDRDIGSQRPTTMRDVASHPPPPGLPAKPVNQAAPRIPDSRTQFRSLPIETVVTAPRRSTRAMPNADWTIDQEDVQPGVVRVNYQYPFNRGQLVYSNIPQRGETSTQVAVTQIAIPEPRHLSPSEQPYQLYPSSLPYQPYPPYWPDQPYQPQQSSQSLQSPQTRQVYEPCHPTAGPNHHPHAATTSNALPAIYPGVSSIHVWPPTWRPPPEQDLTDPSHPAASTHHSREKLKAAAQLRRQHQTLQHTMPGSGQVAYQDRDEQVVHQDPGAGPTWSAVPPDSSIAHTALRTDDGARVFQPSQSTEAAASIPSAEVPRRESGIGGEVETGRPARRTSTTSRSGLMQFALMVTRSAGLLSRERLQAAIDEAPDDEDSDEEDLPSSKANYLVFPNINPLPERRADTPFSRFLRVIETMPQLDGNANPLYDERLSPLPGDSTQNTAFFIGPTTSQAGHNWPNGDGSTSLHYPVEAHSAAGPCEGSSPAPDLAAGIRAALLRQPDREVGRERDQQPSACEARKDGHTAAVGGLLQESASSQTARSTLASFVGDDGALLQSAREQQGTATRSRVPPPPPGFARRRAQSASSSLPRHIRDPQIMFFTVKHARSRPPITLRSDPASSTDTARRSTSDVRPAAIPDCTVVGSLPLRPSTSLDAQSLEKLMARDWTLYFSRTVPAASKLGSGEAKADYTDESVPIFSTRSLETFFSGWNTARAHIANLAGSYGSTLGHTADLNTGRLGLEQLREGISVHLFADGVRPVWEDTRCKEGGRIMLAGGSDEMDRVFFELALLLISGKTGGLYPPESPTPQVSIVGICMSRRRGSLGRVEVWIGGLQSPPPDLISGVEGWMSRYGKIFRYGPFFKPSPQKMEAQASAQQSDEPTRNMHAKL